MSNELRIARDGTELGSWSLEQVRQFISAGSLLPTDQWWSDEAQIWVPLLPKPSQPVISADWIGDAGRPFYYIRDGVIYGPRTAAELFALFHSGLLADSDLVSGIGLSDWCSMAALISVVRQLGITDIWAASQDIRLLEQQRRERTQAIQQHLLSGNLLGAAITFGAHLLTSTPPPPSDDKDRKA